MTGIEMLEQARTHAPGAKFLLLTAYADTDVAIKAINDIGLDYYLLKPWDPPEERLYPVIDDLLGDWRQANPDHTSDVRVVGHRWSDRSHEIKTFLARNYVPYRWYDVERDAEGQRLRDLAGATAADLPLVLVPDGETAPLAHHPRARRRARAAHARRAAAVRRVHRRRRPGRPGRRGVRGVGGPEHRDRRARGARRTGRAERGDRELPRLPEGTERLRPHPARAGPGLPLRRRDGARPRRRRLRDPRPGARRALRRRRARSRPARSSWRPGCPTGGSTAAGLDELTGRGVYYGANASEAQPVRGRRRLRRRCRQLGRPGALNLARFAKRVVLVVRGATLTDTMSQYLVDRIIADAEHRGALPQRGGGGAAATATSRRSRSATGTPARPRRCRPAGCSSSSAPRRAPSGSAPRSSATTRASSSPARTCWRRRQASAWPLARAPYALETSVPGVFAAGDVRLDSMKRVASAVGEGAMSVYLVHRYLATI